MWFSLNPLPSTPAVCSTVDIGLVAIAQQCRAIYMKNKVSYQLYLGLFSEIFSKPVPSTQPLLPTNHASCFAIGQYEMALYIK